MKQLLIDARNEIIELRRRAEILNAQIGVVEVFAAALGLRRGEGGMSPDVAWMLQRQIDELTNAEKNEAVSAHEPGEQGEL